MNYILKTNTAARIPVGPLVDPTDGITAETGLTVTGLSVQLYQIKNDGSAVVRTQFNPTASGGNNDMVLVASSTDGMYDLELTAAQLNFLGNARISFYDVDGFCVHWIDLHVVSAAYFDWLYGATIPDVNVTKIAGTSQTARDIGASVLLSSGSGTGQLDFTSGVVKANLAQILGTALTETAGLIAAAFRQFFNVSTPTGTINDITSIETKIDNTFDDVGDVQATVDLILTDTGTTLPAQITALDAVVDTVKVDTAAILLDTAEIQTELADGGRLDLLIDKAAEGQDAHTDTTEILTRLPDATAGATGGLAIVGSAMTLATATITSIAAAVWAYLLTAMTTVGSIGARLVLWLSSVPSGATAFGATDLVICNNALMLLGNTAIDALTDNTKAAKLCTQFYQQTVDATLRAYTWNCATVRSAALGATTTPAFEDVNDLGGYAFTLPTDCIRVLDMYGDPSYKFRIENNLLITSEATAQISYIKRITAASMDSLLQDAISARLAATIAFSLTNSASAAEAMWKLYKDKLDEAQTTDAFEGTAPQMASNDWINSRS